MQKIRVMIVDDHSLVLEGIRRVIETEFEVVGAVSNGRELLDFAPACRPDVAILDISLPLMNGIEVARRLHKIMPSVRTVFVTQMDGREYIRHAFQAGASGYVLKQSFTSDLAEAIRTAVRGGTYLSPEIRDLIPEGSLRSVDGFDDQGTGSLTQRQREVLQMVAEGLTGKEIAFQLGISTRTVEFHKRCLMDALGLRSTAHLTRYAIQNGLAPSSKAPSASPVQ